MGPDVPLPWERVLWSGRSSLVYLRRPRYVLTDFRLVVVAPDGDEILLDDIADIQLTASRRDRLTGRATLVVRGRAPRTRPVVLHGIARGRQVAALIELLRHDRATVTPETAAALLDWEPHAATPLYRASAVTIGTAVALVLLLAFALHGTAGPVVDPPDDPIRPDGRKRSQAEIVRFMETDVMPWARRTLGPLRGGADRVTCETCHGGDGRARGWQMPGVAALPQPAVRNGGWERYSHSMDAQMRNAIYGYTALAELQGRAGYMREVVMPGMAALLKRPPYDFTRPYDDNRSRRAFGCYHCHDVR